MQANSRSARERGKNGEYVVSIGFSIHAPVVEGMWTSRQFIRMQIKYRYL